MYYTIRVLGAVCSGGFATNVPGAIVLVNITSKLHALQRDVSKDDEVEVEISVLPTPVTQPEGVMVSPTDSRLYLLPSTFYLTPYTFFLTPYKVRLYRRHRQYGIGGHRCKHL